MHNEWLWPGGHRPRAGPNAVGKVLGAVFCMHEQQNSDHLSENSPVDRPSGPCEIRGPAPLRLGGDADALPRAR